MNKVELLEVSKLIGSNPIAKSPRLAAGDYAVQKNNDNYNIIAEINGKWESIDMKQVSKLTAGVRWIVFNTVTNHKTNKPVTASVNLEFTDVALKTNLLMNVNEKGYTSIDLKPLTAAQLKAFKADTIAG